ncbi:prenyltransferase [Natronoarchaeum sp. GCM10025321]|uniref:prenyltransferase n=1 Tax=Natronoarchaeum sp. GCM10025321 TaxID=3252684 RepID=UPI00361828BB
MQEGNRVTGTLRALWGMARPTQLLLIFGVYGFGAVVAHAVHQTVDWTALRAGIPPLLLVAASVHYANEYADYETDALTDRTPFSGGSGALHATGLPRRLAAQATVGAFVAAVLAVVLLYERLSPTVVALLAVILVFGWQYSLPPLALAWNGWGELDNALLGGLVLPVYGYTVATGSVSATAVAASLPFTVVVFLNLLDTTWPDRTADAAVGKYTLATRWDAGRLRQLYAGVAVVAVASPVALGATVLPDPISVTALVATPFLAWGTLWYTRRRSPLPTVATMLVVLVVQILAWLLV